MYVDNAQKCSFEVCYYTLLSKEKNEWSFKNERLLVNSVNNKIRDFLKITID